MEGRKYFEELNVGDKFVTPRRTITESLMSNLTNLAGCNASIFQDAEYAKATPLGWQAAPGEVTWLLMAGLEEQALAPGANSIAMVGAENLKFLAPLKAGDTIRVEVEIVSKRETKRPDRGIIVFRERCINQKGEVLIEADKVELVRRRPK